MVGTQLPQDVCRKVWNLSNPKGLDTFTVPMFLIAIHLLYKRKKDESIQLPDSIPNELL